MVLAGYMSLVKNTTRWRVIGRENIEPVWASGRGVVGCVWHARVLMTIAGWPKDVQPPTIMISRSPDGEFVARAAKTLNVGVIRGSSRNEKKTKQKGGVAAALSADDHLKAGGCLAITPDGPRGPRMRAKVGPVKLARNAQVPLIAFAWSTRWRVVFKSWDRFVLPLPFGRGVIVWEGPADPPPPGASERDVETVRARLETMLISANQRADAEAGVEVIEPAPAPRSRAAQPDPLAASSAPAGGDPAPEQA